MCAAKSLDSGSQSLTASQRHNNDRRREEGRVQRRYHTLDRSISLPWMHQAVAIFLSDITLHISSRDNCPTRGHFGNLTSLIEPPTTLTALRSALEAVALASLAHRINSSEARSLAVCRYVASLSQLRGNIDLGSKNVTQNLIACILLLAMYEMVLAEPGNSPNWQQHLHGLVAIMQTGVACGHVPASDIASLVLRSLSHHELAVPVQLGILKSHGVMGPPPLACGDLYAILPRVQILFRESTPVLQAGSIRFESALRQYRDRAICLRCELLAWSSSQPKSKQSSSIRHFTQPYTLQFPGVEHLVCPVTRADSYQNSSRWNSYRQCLMHLTNLLDQISLLLSTDPQEYNSSQRHSKLSKDIKLLADDVCASIPYMLVCQVTDHGRPFGPTWFLPKRPMLLGGFSLQWVLFTISILPTISDFVRQKVKDVLGWIGRNLGIGQATVLSQMDSNPPGGITAKGDSLRWVAYLV